MNQVNKYCVDLKIFFRLGLKGLSQYTIFIDGELKDFISTKFFRRFSIFVFHYNKEKAMEKAQKEIKKRILNKKLFKDIIKKEKEECILRMQPYSLTYKAPLQLWNFLKIENKIAYPLPFSKIELISGTDIKPRIFDFKML